MHSRQPRPTAPTGCASTAELGFPSPVTTLHVGMTPADPAAPADRLVDLWPRLATPSGQEDLVTASLGQCWVATKERISRCHIAAILR